MPTRQEYELGLLEQIAQNTEGGGGGGAGGTVEQGAAGVDPWLVEVTNPTSGTVEQGAAGDEAWLVSDAAVLAAIAALPQNNVLAASTNNIGDVDVLTLPNIGLVPDAGQGTTLHLRVTLSTAETVTTITLPDSARIVQLFPKDTSSAEQVRWAIGENPAPLATSSAATIAASAFGAGGIAKASQWETIVLPAGSSRTLRLRSATASHAIDVVCRP